MDDYIRRRDAKIAIQNALYDGTGYGEALNAVPAADVRPVVRGEWLPYEFEIKPYKYGKPLWVKCSVCGKPSQIRNEPYASKYSCETIMTENILNFCRICGADMRKEETP